MRRIFDVTVAIFGIIITSPLLLLIAIWIKASSRGPILYGQTRVGRYEKHFRLYKFRSMVVNADQLGTSVTTGHDPRITRVGRFLRRTKLDELPQLWNVLRGDMSFVGPRPDVPEIIATYTLQMLQILNIRPGITSIASLHLCHEEDILSLARDPDDVYIRVVVPAKIALAMEHVIRDSFVFDMEILFHTLWRLTVGRLTPSPEHPRIQEIRRQIAELNQQVAVRFDVPMGA